MQPRTTPSSAALVFALAAPLLSQQVQFMPAQTRPLASFVPNTAAVLGGLAIGDVDGGLPDIVVCDRLLGFVFSQGASGFSGLQLAPALSLHEPKLRDLDGDGDLDLVFGPSRPSVVTPGVVVVQNLGNGQFQQVALPAALASGSAVGLAIGDVDGDGDLDLVVAAPPGAGRPPLALYRQGPGLAFAADAAAMPPSLPFGSWPHLVDVDNDGDLDVVASASAAFFLLLQNQGGGTFVDRSNQMPTQHIGHVFSCTGDFDGDGFVDLAAMWWNGDLDVLWGSAGGFALQPSAVPGAAATTLHPADVDGDGDLDIVTWQPTRVALLRNLGSRQFAASTLLDRVTNGIATGDVDLDGAADVLVASPDGPVECWFRAVPGATDALLEAGLREPNGTRRNAPCAGDVDGDGRTDVLLPNSAGLGVNLARGNGRYQWSLLANVQPLGNAVEYWQLRDMDADGDPDLVVSSTATVRLFDNDGAGVFSAGPSLPFATSGNDATRVGDVTNDGLPDIVRCVGGVTLYRNLGNGQFPATVLASSAVLTTSVELCDVDGDGDLDIVSDLTPVPGGPATLLRNDGGGSFALNPPGFALVTGGAAVSIAGGDVDGDGDRDLVVETAIAFRLFVNDGSGGFTEVTATQLPPLAITGGGNVLLVDVDGDGDRDIVSGSAVNNQAGILLLNSGNGSFLNASASRIDAPVAIGVARVNAVDADDDGDVDLLMGGGQSLFSLGDHAVLWNHLRQCYSAVAPRVGGTFEVDMYCGPGFAPAGLQVLALSPQPLPGVHLSGIAGVLDIDPNGLLVLSVGPTSLLGVSRTIAPIPVAPQFAGLEVYVQGAVLTAAGIGLTDSFRERVLP